MFLWDEIRFELYAIVIDRNRNVGITSTLTYSHNELVRFNNSTLDPAETRLLTNDICYFNVFIPLRLLLGFYEDFKQVIIRTKQELVLIRSRSNVKAKAAFSSTDTEKAKIVRNNIILKIPHEITQKLQFLHYIEMSEIFQSTLDIGSLMNFNY